MVDTSPFPDLLFGCYVRLRSHFGYHPRWWPGSPNEIAFTAFLVQQADYSVVSKRVRGLADAGKTTLSVLAHATPEDVLNVIRGVSYAPTKALRLVAFAREIVGRGFADVAAYLSQPKPTAELRAELLSFAGIGRETADCILLYAGTTHPVFVVDAFTRRVFTRLAPLGLGAGFWSQPYDRLRTFFEEHVRAGLPRYRAAFEFAPDVPHEVAVFRDWHALVCEIARHHCGKKNPRCAVQGKSGWSGYSFCDLHCESCSACPLADRCARASTRS